MTKIDKEMILKIASLSKLKVTEEDVQIYIPQLTQVLEHFSELKTLDTSNVEPLITPIPLEAYHREDVAIKTETSEELLEQAPDRVGMLYKVPPVM